jgi:general stress protein 26
MRPTSVLALHLVLVAPAASVAQVSPPAPPSRAQVVAATRAVMQAARYATFVTIGRDDAPQARVVDPFAPEADLTVWIGTNPRTRKVADISRDPRVTLLFFNAADEEYVTMHGSAMLVTDAAEKSRHWKPEWGDYYKDGPRGDDYALIRVRPTRLEVVSPRHGVLNDPTTWKPVIVDLP